MKRVKKLIRTLHLWLGLMSGLVVFIVAVTGCVYAFQEEIQNAIQSYRFVQREDKAMLPPSVIRAIADNALPGKHIHAVMYHDSIRAAKAIYFSFEDRYYYFVYVNPYTGEVLKVKDEFADFFRFILNGHFYLWLPPHIGQPVVATATLIFFVLIVSGIILWWPKKKKDVKKRFSIKWDGSWRRKNYDLHSVVGLYVSAIALVFVVTGLVWGFIWFRDGVYFVASGGDSYIDYYNPPSDTTQAHVDAMEAVDRVWLKMVREYPHAEWIEVHPPEDEVGAIAANANDDGSTYWKTDYRYFDQRTLEELPVTHMYGRFHEASFADKLMRMNYDVHTGGIFGFAGKLFAFFASLICASLPVTGVCLWWGRRNKSVKVKDSPSEIRRKINRKTELSVK